MSDFIINDNILEEYTGDEETVIIPDGVTEIGPYVFFGLKIENIFIPDSVREIDENAFCKCRNLTRIEFPKNIKHIAHHAFAYCTGLREVNLSCGLESIGASAFEGCSCLEDIFIPQSVKKIGLNAFHKTPFFDNADTSIIVNNTVYKCIDEKYVNIPYGVTALASNLFAESKGDCLMNIDMPETLAKIGNAAFDNCFNLDDVTIPNSVLEIGSCAFRGCISLESIALPLRLSKISSSLFLGCVLLRNITLPENITMIDKNAFKDCERLEKIRIPDKVIKINKNAFSGCENLTEFIVPEDLDILGIGLPPTCKIIRYARSKGNNSFGKTQKIPVVVKEDSVITNSYAVNAKNTDSKTESIDEFLSRFL